MDAFTRENHLTRGYCCGLGCKHCPYDGCPGSTHIMKSRIEECITKAKKSPVKKSPKKSSKKILKNSTDTKNE